MALQTIAGIGAPKTLGKFQIASRQIVDGPGDRRTSGVFHAFHEFFRVFPLRGHVELIPGSGAARLGHVFHGDRRLRGENLHRVLGFRCATGGEFAIVVEHALTANGAQEDRAVVLHAEQLHAVVDLRNVHQTARAELDAMIAFDVRLISFVVVHTGGHIAPVRGRQNLARETFEVHHL